MICKSFKQKNNKLYYSMKWVYILKCEDDHYYVGET